jgi:hypothetical protein
MKLKNRFKFLTITTVALLAFSVTSPGTAEESAIKNTSGVEILNGNVIGQDVYPLSDGTALISWLEATNQKAILKVKVASKKNKLSAAVTLNEAGSPNREFSYTLPRIVVNDKNKIFASWIKETEVSGSVTQSVMGSISTGGIKWSKPFTIIPSRTFDNLQDCDSPREIELSCGFSQLTSAIDQKGRLAIGVTSNEGSNGSKFEVTTASKQSAWKKLKLLTKRSAPLTQTNILGLADGFAMSLTNYTGNDCSIISSYFDPKTSTWQKANIAKTGNLNSQIFSRWVQRDASNLSLVIDSELAGIEVRNYSLKKKAFSNSWKVWQTTPENTVFGSLTTYAAGKRLVVQYRVYDQITGSTEVRVALQEKIGGSIKFMSIGKGRGLVEPLYVGSFSQSAKFFSYDGVDEKVARIYTFGSNSNTAKIIPLHNPSSNLANVRLGTNGRVYILEITQLDSGTSLYLTTGNLNFTTG